ncbi:condensation domain-containing protein [Actinophytocola gossypii]|uniref:Peptide synthase n=1 Tax=Actinophytocola gossypii TaxID=2812003 RepID=A0ABT2JHE4_9PSEU|nr:condensation domain-containing protein [Actinophytocola gossypii]MCT2586810.1 peptide synthase [Actinophytocola gossypii]
MTATEYPLSFNQEFLCGFDKGEAEGAFSRRHTLVFGWRLTGVVNLSNLRDALADLVVRHEPLRTSIEQGPDGYRQFVHEPSVPNLTVTELSGSGSRDDQAEEFLNTLDAGEYSAWDLPLVHAFLGRFDERDSVLVLAVHHVSTDLSSMQLLIRDLAALYTARSRDTEPALPPVVPYREFATWQTEHIRGEKVAQSLEYWRGKLDGARIQALPTDRAKSDELVNQYAVHRFVFDRESTSAMLKFAASVRSSAFIVLVAAYNVLLHRRLGTTDAVVPSFTSGRSEDRFLDTVGPMFNYLLLRTDLSGEPTFREIVKRTRNTCFESYLNDIPFGLIAGQNPDLLAGFADPAGSVVAFEVLQVEREITDGTMDEVRYSEIRRRVRSQALSSDIPDGVLWANEVLPTGELCGSVKYNVNLFDEATIVKLVNEFGEVLTRAVADPDSRLQDI